MTQRQKTEKKLDDIVRDIIKKRDEKRGCITCGQNCALTTGHFMKRRHLATRWNLTNVNGQCWECNSKDDWEEYKAAMITKYGEPVTESIISLARLDIRFTTAELEEKYERLKSIHNF